MQQGHSFYIRQILNFSNSFKLILVVTWRDITSPNSTIMLDAIEALFKSFNSTHVNNLSSSSFVVVTQSPKKQEIVKTEIREKIKANTPAGERSNQFWNHIIDKNQISVFEAPKNEGKVFNPPIWAEVEKVSYLDAKHILSSLYISDSAKGYLDKEILPYFTSNLNQVLHMLFDVIIDVDSLLTKDSNLLQKKYHLIQEWITETSNIELINNNSQSDSNKISQKIYFPKLNLQEKIIQKLSTLIKNKSGTSITILSEMLKYLSNFDNIETKNLLEKYAIALSNQEVFLKFLYQAINKDISSFEGKLFKKFEKEIEFLGDKLYSESIPNLVIKPQQETGYYNEAIKYFNIVLIKVQSINSNQLTSIVQAKIIDCHYNLGNKKQAIKYSLEYIKANKEQFAIYNTLGKIFFEYKKYDTAIKSYKIVSNTYEIKSCFDEWLESDPKNPEIMEKRGDHLRSIDRFDEARKYYQDALGLSSDKTTREELERKANYCMKVNPISNYNYELVPELEDSLNQMLLGDLDTFAEVLE